MDFIIGLLISANLISENYNFILLIVDYLIKVVNYGYVKITIDALSLIKVIIDMVIYYNNM